MERLDPRCAEAVKSPISRRLEERTAEVLEAERPTVLARASPMTPPGDEAASRAGGRGRL
ncbi:MAG: hypothetical protein ACP5KY_05045 [Thermoproteus sp.]